MRLGCSTVALAAMPLVLACSIDLLHSTDWKTRCDIDEAGCQEGHGGAASVATGGAEGGTGGEVGASNGGSGGSAVPPDGCASDVEDCLTPEDDDCDGVPNDGCDLLLYLAFDEGSGTKLVDSSGAGNDGTHAGAYARGVRGTAIAFDGTSMAVVPPSPRLVWGANDDDFTVSYWIMPLAPPTGLWRVLLHRGNTACGPGDRVSADFLAPMTMVLHACLSTTALTTCNEECLDTAPLGQGAWMHVAQVKQGANHLHYTNGVLELSGTINPVVSNEAPLYLGSDPWHSAFTGLMDELQVYGHALGPAEIAKLAAP